MHPHDGEMEQKRSFGRVLLNILKLVGFIILALIPIQVIVVLIEMQDQFSTVVNSILAIASLIITILIIMFLWNRYYKYTKEKVQKMGLRDIGIAFLFFLAARVVAIVGTLLINWVYGEDMTANDAALMSITDGSNTFVLYFLMFVLAIGFLVPIVEELAYRGIATHLLFRKKTLWLPLIITSAIFGFLHTATDIISFLLYSSIGAILFLSYYRRKNILDSMLVHILNNGVSAIFMLLLYIIDWL